VLRARVFPLIPGALHRIVVGYDLDLDQVGDDLEYRLDLPDLDVDKVVTLRVLELADTPIVVTPEAEGRPNDGRIEYNLSGRDLSTITVRLQAPGTIVLHTTDDRVGPLFASRLRPEVPTRMASHPMREVVFAVDVSLSSNPERFNIWLDLVEAILEANRSSINRFAVVFFNVESFWWRPTFVINSWENVTQLRMFADGLALEGATDIVAALSEATNPTQLDIKETRPLRRWPVFLLSDGAATWGKDLAPQLETDGHPVFVFTTGLRGADASALAQIARSTGGAVFSVTDESEVRAASSAHRLQSCRLEAVEAAGTSDVLIAGRPLNVYPGQTLTVVGRGVPEGSIRFWLSSAAGYKDPVVEVRPRHVIESELALRSYGQVATELLESRGAPAAADATAYASYFRVIGRSCSLLMLENERDYQRLGIAESDHRATVAAHPVSTVIAALPEEAGREPALRRWLMDWLDAHGTHDQWLAGLKKGIEALPAASFEVEVEPLRCRLRRSKQIPPELGSHLASGEVTADELHAEAERRIAAGSPADALRTISSLAEGFPDNPSVLRDVALAGSKWGFGGHAYHLLRRCAETRCSRPEVFSEMAQVLAHAGHADLAIAYFEVALSAAGQGDLGRAIEGSYLDLLRRVKAGELDTKLGELVDPRIEALTGYHVES
jgi:hypothetical protein